MLEPDSASSPTLPTSSPPPFEAPPWSLRASWIITILALPCAALVAVAAALIPDASVRTLWGLVLAEAGFVVPVVVFVLWRRIALRSLGFRSFAPSALAIGCGTTIIAYSLIIVHNSILLALNWQTQGESILRFLDSQGSPWGLVLGGVLVGPLLEEIVFRGFFFQGLRSSYGSLRAIVFSSAVFGLAHLEPAALIPTFLLGCALAFVYDRSKSIWPGVILHMLINAVGVFGLLLSSFLPASA